MNDCMNAEIRDQLPDLLHERLDESARAVVLTHVSACVDCRDELQLLRDVHGMLVVQAPKVDIGRIVQALPRPVAPAVPSVRAASARRRVWSDWRVAAAVTLLVAGGGSYAIVRSTLGPVPVGNVAPTEIAKTTPAIAPTSAPGNTSPAITAAPESVVATTATNEDHASADLGTDNRLGDLSEQQLQTLLNDIDKLHAVPVTDPEPVAIRVNAKTSGSSL